MILNIIEFKSFAIILNKWRGVSRRRDKLMIRRICLNKRRRRRKILFKRSRKRRQSEGRRSRTPTWRWKRIILEYIKQRLGLKEFYRPANVLNQYSKERTLCRVFDNNLKVKVWYCICSFEWRRSYFKRYSHGLYDTFEYNWFICC